MGSIGGRRTGRARERATELVHGPVSGPEPETVCHTPGMTGRGALGRASRGVTRTRAQSVNGEEVGKSEKKELQETEVDGKRRGFVWGRTRLEDEGRRLGARAKHTGVCSQKRGSQWALRVAVANPPTHYLLESVVCP